MHSCGEKGSGFAMECSMFARVGGLGFPAECKGVSTGGMGITPGDKGLRMTVGVKELWGLRIRFLCSVK